MTFSRALGPLVVTIFLAALLTVGCGSKTTVKTSADGGDSAGGGAGTSQAAPAKIGSVIPLAGMENLKMEVTLLKFKPIAKSSDEYMQPETGMRYAAVQIELRNVGDVAYSDSPTNGAALIDTKDQTYSAAYFDAIKPGIGSPTIAPGAKRIGWLTFEVLKNAKLKTFQLALDSGFADETGEWGLTK
jgi:hypothetical protein